MLGSNSHGLRAERELFGANLFAAGATDVAMRADPGLHAISFAADPPR